MRNYPANSCCEACEISMENIVLFSLFSVTRQIHLPLYIYLQLSTYPPSSIYVYVYPYLLIYLCAPINLPICLYLSVYLYTRFYLPIIYLYLSLSLYLIPHLTLTDQHAWNKFSTKLKRSPVLLNKEKEREVKSYTLNQQFHLPLSQQAVFFIQSHFLRVIIRR